MTTPSPIFKRIRPRDPAEPHRAASPLELFFDLVFVVAVSFSSQQLHHMEGGGHLGQGVLGYLMVFFAIWWAWMNFTWFGTSFGSDDWLYRVLTFVQMAGVLVLAAGVSAAMEDHDFALVTYGYVVMRLALVTQWLRVAASVAEFRATALRYAGAITVVQIAWLLRLLLPETVGFIAFFVLVVAEVAVPIWAESRAPTPWHPEHIAERFSLFTLILLGESILASANAVVEALAQGRHPAQLVVVAAAGLVMAAGIWWIYFSGRHDRHIRTLDSSLRFGYFHYLIFAAVGSFSAGVEVTVDRVLEGHADVEAAAAFTLLVPVAVFMVGVWILTLRREFGAPANAIYLAGVVLVVLAVLTPTLAMVVMAAAGVSAGVMACQLASWTLRMKHVG